MEEIVVIAITIADVLYYCYCFVKHDLPLRRMMSYCSGCSVVEVHLYRRPINLQHREYCSAYLTTHLVLSSLNLRLMKSRPSELRKSH